MVHNVNNLGGASLVPGVGFLPQRISSRNQTQSTNEPPAVAERKARANPQTIKNFNVASPNTSIPRKLFLGIPADDLELFDIAGVEQLALVP